MSQDATGTKEPSEVEAAVPNKNTKLNRFVQFFDGGWGEEGAYREKKFDFIINIMIYFLLHLFQY